MKNRVEPPVLLSRLMTFVFVAMLVITVVLIITLYKLFPTNHPQVFFLATQPKQDLQITLSEFTPRENTESVDGYKRAFIREYIKARNEIFPNIKTMRKKWGNDESGVIRTWSTDDVYKDFADTDLWNYMMNDITTDFYLRCPVEFHTGAVKPYGDNLYEVSFSYFCEDSGGQLPKKDYTIRIKLETDNDRPLKWSDKLDNPLGIRVSEYSVTSGGGDPLNALSPDETDL